MRSVGNLHSEIVAVYLFGSVLTRDNPEDIDIAVLVDEKQLERSRYPFPYLGSLISELNELGLDKEIDVVLLNSASPIICMQVLRTGKKVFERNGKAVIVFMVQAMGRYHDLKIIRKPIEQNILQGRIYG
jgi:Nucleotidyltransferase domain.